MPWCPKCKNEYRDGIKVCADCGCELIENENAGLLPILFGTLEEMELLKDFLVYSHIESASVRAAEEEGFYELLVEASEEKHAKKLAIMFIQQRTKEQAELKKTEEDEETVPVGLYEDSAQKAEDNKSSGITLLFVGFLGIIVLILAMTGVIPLRLSPTTSYMVYGVMGALFILFIVMGVVSMRNSKIFAKKAESENSLRSTIEEWCLHNLEAQALDKEAFGEGAAMVSEEAKYFGRANILKKKISTQFMNLDNQFLDHFVDEIYEDIFEEE
ncbi:MAG: hypothetical protein IJ282_10550 [Lachnospiraceae bacterium]|nr:hypothetical protein [Lachnospiraceae bacterium]